MPGIGGSSRFFMSSSIGDPRKGRIPSLPTTSAAASRCSTLRSWLASLDAIIVFVATDEASSDAKDVAPAVKLLMKNKPVKILVAPYIFFSSILISTKQEQQQQCH